MSGRGHIAKCVWISCALIYFSIACSPCLAVSLHADKVQEVPDYGSLFSSDDILRVTILSDFSAIMADRGEDRSYHKGELYYIASGQDTVSRKIKLKTRGNFRRNPTNCRYPPIMIKFGKLKSADSIFSGQEKLKLVTQCQFENYVLLEYLAYRIHNLLTNDSYRVRLAHVTYADLESRETYFTRYAFFIESDQELMHRLDAEKYRPHVVQYFMEKENIHKVAMFQYMIGNNDWFVRSNHNVTILKLHANDGLIAVPYDFDWSELVNADYTRPKGVPAYLLSERRVYKGLCLDEEEFERLREVFQERKAAILDLFSSIVDLPISNVKESQKYIEKFYKILDSRASLEKIFQKEQCIVETAIEGGQ